MKDFKTVTLTSEHLFAFCEVLDAIGIDKFSDIFSDTKDVKDEDAETAGRAVGAKIIKVLIKELPNAKNSIYNFLSICVEGINAEEIKAMPLVEFINLIKAVFTADEMKDFFTQATSLFTKE